MATRGQAISAFSYLLGFPSFLVLCEPPLGESADQLPRPLDPLSPHTVAKNTWTASLDLLVQDLHLNVLYLRVSVMPIPTFAHPNYS